MIGTQLAHYRITAALGAGGMGEVWRATDTKLDREVALKVLPAEFAADPQRFERFEREAKVLASLNHPNIAHLYGLENSVILSDGASGAPESTSHGEAVQSRKNPPTSPESHPKSHHSLASGDPSTRSSDDLAQDDSRGVTFLVMELVEGEDLSDRMARGPISVEDAIPIALQIAEALEAAHEQGIVHRDLKPANIKLARDGSVKVLDFGLAKSWEKDQGDSSLSLSPTMTAHATAAGVILGTAAYMSPEQARGQQVDRRADIWAFGVVLWEMLTGHKLFAGDTVTDVLAAVLTREVDLGDLPPAASPSLRRLLARCLERQPRDRLQWIGDARLELQDVNDLPPHERDAPPYGSWIGWAVAAVAIVIGCSAIAWSVLQPKGRSSEPIHLELADAGFTSSSNSSIAPNGQMVAYCTNDSDAILVLETRRLDSFEPGPISGVKGGENPFFSPDGKWLAFFAPNERAVGKASLEDGTVQKFPGVQVSGYFNSGTWHPDGYLILSGAVIEGNQWLGLVTVPDSGGAPKILTSTSGLERRHYLPEVVDGSPWVLFTVSTVDGQSVAAVSLETGEQKVVLEGASTPRFLESGHLLVFRPAFDDLAIALFDPDSATLLGGPESVLSPVGETNRGTGQYVLADNGTLIYDPPSTGGSEFFLADVVLVDRAGGIVELDAEKASWSQPRFSPDGDQLLLRRIETPNCDLWTRDLERGTTTRITFEHDTHDPLWDPSGGNVMYAGDQGARRSVFRVASDGSSAPGVMIDADVSMYPASWSADGRRLVLGVVNQHSGDDVWVLDLDRGSEPFPFLDSRFGERYPVFSPDGRWIAYASDESGHWEIFVRPYPGPGGRVQVSTDGGTEPLWSPDGAELFYRADGKIWEAGVTESSEGLRVSTPTPLFDDHFERVTGANPDQRQYDISPAGDVFAMIRPDPRANEQRPLRVVIDWLEAALESLEDE